MLAALLLLALGAGGLWLLVQTTRPELGPRWLFYFLLTAGATGLALPFVWLLNRRFSHPAPPPGVMWREGLLVGLYVATSAWLQLNRVLSLTLALLFGLGLGVIEWLLRVLERSRRREEP